MFERRSEARVNVNECALSSTVRCKDNETSEHDAYMLYS